jgi:hypothetical protein
MNINLSKLTAVILSLICASTAFADVKIKTKQTANGQSYENTTYIKGKRSRTESMNGASVNITQCDLKRGVQINPATRTYMINEFVQALQSGNANTSGPDQSGAAQVGGKVTTTITTKDTGERKPMFGYTAKHLIITMETVSSPDACSPTNTKMQMDGWYIDAEFALDCDFGQTSNAANPYARKGCTDKYEVKQIGTVKRGYPVYEKMSMIDQSGKEVYAVTNEVVELSKATLEASLFDVPADYRQVNDAAQMYATTASSTTSITSMGQSSTTSLMSTTQSNSAVAQSIRANSTPQAASAPSAAKKAGTIRIGLAGVKTGAVGEGINPAELATAVRNSLAEYLKVPNVEIVSLDAKLASAIDAEAKEKQCDFVIYAGVSHKKGGGGGFGGMFGQTLGMAVGRVGIGGLGNTAANIAGQVATQAIVTATSMSSNVKSKDEVTLDVRVSKIGAADVLSQQFKAKAKSNGDDIISQVVEQAAQAIVNALGSN